MRQIKIFIQNFKKIAAEFGNQKFKCRVCKQIHSGVYSSTVCQDCYTKGHR